MADEDDFAMMDDTDLDWLYVEDDYPLADELAEMQIPDPGYAGTNLEIALEHDDSDYIDYWDELEYMDDEYWDNAQLGALATSTTTKRKRDDFVEGPAGKRRRMAMAGMENVKFVSLSERLERFYHRTPRPAPKQSFALLPDWRERFTDQDAVFVKKAMPAAMKHAAEAREQVTPPKERRHDALVGEDQEWMDEDDIEGDEHENEVDEEAFKNMLQERLGDSVDVSAFTAAITKMQSGEEGAEEALAELTNTLLEQATKSNDPTALGLLSQLGVSLDAPEEEDDDATSVVTAEQSSTSANISKAKIELSPSDSAIEMLQQNGEKMQVVMHGSSPSSSAKKRPAPLEAEEVVTKKTKLESEPPQSALSTNTDHADKVEVGIHPIDATSVAPIEKDTALPSPPNTQTTPMDPTTTSAPAPAKTDTTAQRNGTASTIPTSGKNYAKPTTAAAARQTRKRKADTADEEIEASAPKAKKLSRKAAKAESNVPAVEPPARRTRSTRAKAGK